ncbi:MAG: S8 family serine peptidase, partial [Candidatus Buchananbacteria bacterium]
MKNIRKIICLILVFGIFGGNFLFLADFSLAKNNQADQSEYQPETLLIKLKGSSQVLKFEFTNSVNLEKAAAQYKKNPAVEYVEYNYQLKMAGFPNDPDYYLQWYFNPINGRDAWSTDLLIRETENIYNHRPVIAILDTGVDLNHPDLKEKIWTNSKETVGDGLDNDKNGYVDDWWGWDFIDNDNDPNPSFAGNYDITAVKHGTIVAGVAAASSNNSQGITGTSWFAKIMPLRVLDSTGTGDVY